MSPNAPIAIVGLGCRLPGDSSNPEKLWQVLSEGKSCYSKVPADRFNVDAYRHEANELGTVLPEGGHFLSEDVSLFDASFFNLTPSDAKTMDPQQRMLLEVVYEALEGAGLSIESLAGSDTSCHVGCFTRDWTDLLMRDPEAAPKYSVTGMGLGMQANRVSWFFDWRGPSLTLDTACSSSLVAVHLACQSIRQGESRVAVAAGSSLILNPDLLIWMSNMNFLSKDGRCKSFDASADGYGRGEGVAVVVLKDLRDALRDGDSIRAVIRGSGVNQDGHTSGITLPNSGAQAELIRSVYERAGLAYDDTTYFEAHGTGTRAGDEAELKAILETIAKNRNIDRKLHVGSIKSNIGHTEGTAGIAGLIKTVLMLEKGLIAPNVNLIKLNSRALMNEARLVFPTTLTPWPSSGIRRASVSSFGYGGTNAHVVVDDAASCIELLDATKGHHGNTSRSGSAGPGEDCDTDRSASGGRTPSSGILSDIPALTMSDDGGGLSEGYKPRQWLMVLSTHDESAMQSLMLQYSKHLQQLVYNQGSLAADPLYIDRLAHTLSTRRSRLPWGSFAVADSLEGMVEKLSAKDVKAVRSLNKPRVGFVFTGQGAQWAGMGRELLYYPVFRTSVLAADEYLHSSVGSDWSVVEELSRDAGSSNIGLARYSQPLCTILQIALIQLLESWGITPVAVAGHSSGEIAAAVCAGAITHETAWKIAYWRGKLSSDMVAQHPNLKGAMMAVGASVDQVQPYLAQVTSGRVQIACINAPESVTLSGDETGIDEVQLLLNADKLFARKLVVENAYHSYHMDHIADEYSQNIKDCTALDYSSNGTAVRMISSVNGSDLTMSDLQPSYWVRNLTSPVCFSDALSSLLKGESTRRRRRRAECAVDMLLEIGPHAALKGPIGQILHNEGFKNVDYASVLQRGANAVSTALEAAGFLFARGIHVDIDMVNQTGRPRNLLPIVDLPTYPWDHTKSYWAESRISREHRFRTQKRIDLLGAPVADAVNGDPTWRQFLRTVELPWLRDHKIQSSILFPAAGFLCIVIEAARQMADTNRDLDHVELRNVHFDRPMIIPDDDIGVETRLQLLQNKADPFSKGWYEFRLYSGSSGSRLELNSYGYVALRYKSAFAWSKAPEAKQSVDETFRQSLLEVENKCPNIIATSDFYSRTDKLGLNYGPCFQNLTNICHSGGSACATLVVRNTKEAVTSGYEDSHLLHPTTLDCMFQLLFAALEDGSLEAAAVPVFITNLKVRAECPWEAGHGLRGFAETTLSGSTEYAADIVFGDQECNGPMVEVTGIRCRIVGDDSLEDTAAVVVKERYGFLETAPCLQLSSAGGLLKYLEKRRQGRGVADKFLVMGEIIHLVAHASPNATILELSEGQRSTAIEFLSSLGRPIGESLRSVKWTVVNLDPDIRGALIPGTDNVVFDTLSTTLDLKSPTSNRPKQDIILVTSEWLVNIKAQKLEFIKATLKDTGHLIVSTSTPDISNVLTTLSSSGFFDRVIEIPRYGPEAENKATFVVAAKAKYISSFPAIEPVVLLLPKEASERTLWLASEITWNLISHGITVHRRDLQAGSVDLAYGAQCLSLLELECPLPLDTDPDTFDMVKKLTLQATRLLWVAGTSDPRLSIMAGLIRTVRNENPSLDLVSLALGHVSPNNVTTAAESIKDVFVMDSDDKEFILEDGLCCVSRYVTDRALNANIVSQRAQKAKKLVAMSGVSLGLQLETPHPAQPDTWSFKLDHESQSALLPDEVEIETRAVGTNSPDVVTIKGQRPNSFSGQAASGLVTRIGSAVTGFHVGDRVFQLSSRPFKTRLRASEKLCQLNPHGMTFVEAASIPLALCAALGSVRDLGRLRAGETILIHAGASSIGQAAIQVAQYLQAEVFTTVTSLLEQEVLCKQYGIAEDHVFSCMDTSFVQSVKKATRGKGVDVILNCLEGDSLRQSWYCTARFGRFVHLGTRRLGDGASLDMTPFLRSATFACFDFDLMLNEQSEKLSVLLEESTVMIRQGVIKPKQTVKEITATILFVDSHALQHVETGDDVVVSISPDDKIPVHPSALDVVRLRQDATYIIVGGLGGLGRSQALRMAECGAGCILFLSRSGSSDPKAKPLCEDLESRGARAVCWSCDVADATQLRAALDQCAVELPPVKGCIQGAMVLRDGIFETMTHDDFRTSMRPKVHGTWNLHEQLPKELDFFIMLSSISGVTGNPGQANYAAGNTFMDALAHYRRNLGLPAISIDLGLMLDVGFVAERQGVSNLKKWESVGLLEEEYLAIMAAAMQGVLPAPAGGDRYVLPAQIVTGLATGGHVVSHGLDDPFYFADARFKRLVRAELSETETGDSSSDTESLQQLLGASSSVAEAADIIAEAIRYRLGRVIDKDPGNIELGKPLHAYGVDSLMAVEFRNWLVKEMHCSIGLFDVMGSPGIGDLAVKIMAMSKLVPRFVDEI